MSNNAALICSAIIRFFILALFVFGLFSIIYIDVIYIDDQVTESSLTEYTQSILLSLTVLIFGTLTYRLPNSRGFTDLLLDYF